jgi:hypothetical protein
MLPEAPPRHGFVETDELDRIPAELPPTLRPPVRFAAITGRRLASEVTHTAVVSRRPQARRIRIGVTKGETKGGEVRTIHVLGLLPLGGGSAAGGRDSRE